MRTAIASLTFMIAGCGALSPNDHSGVYRDIRTSDETGDTDGIEVEVRDRGQKSAVVFTLCEGGCHGGKTWPAVVDGRYITFAVQDAWLNPQGMVVETTTTHYTGVFDAGRLLLKSPDWIQLNAKLVRLTNPEPGQTAKLGQLQN